MIVVQETKHAWYHDRGQQCRTTLTPRPRLGQPRLGRGYLKTHLSLGMNRFTWAQVPVPPNLDPPNRADPHGTTKPYQTLITKNQLLHLAKWTIVDLK